MQWSLRGNRLTDLAKHRKRIEIVCDREIVAYMVDELSKNPSVEEGGKYVGYILQPGHPRLAEFRCAADSTAIVVIDFLPSGPNATRTAVELMPDGPYQEALFRRIEEIDSEIEHIGSWHSHHCNGLRTLSAGDVAGYFKTVNKPEYNPDFFLASLVKEIPKVPSTPGWIEHFLFVRGEKQYYSATGRMRFVELPTPFRSLTGHGSPTGGPPLGTAHDASARQPKTAPVWFETQEGRDVLAADKRFLGRQFQSDVVATRRDSQITLTGRRGAKSVAVTYPREVLGQHLSIAVKDAKSTILTIDATLPFRGAAYRAALAALDDSEGSSAYATKTSTV